MTIRRMLGEGRETATLQQLLALCESPAEKLFFRATIEHGGRTDEEPGPLVPQYRVGRYRLDFAWPELRLAIEIDGFTYHSSSAAFDRDRRRQRKLELDGWRFLRFTAAEVRKDAAECAQQADDWMADQLFDAIQLHRARLA